MNITYRLMNIEDYAQAYDLWVLCGNGLNNKDDSKEGIAKYHHLYAGHRLSY